MLQSLDEEDYAAIQRLGHNFKGSGESYGFPELTVLGSEIEQSARDQDRRQLQELAAKLNEYLVRIRTA